MIDDTHTRQARATNERYAIGLMSGTSLDGVDAAVCRVTTTGAGPLEYDLSVESFETAEYDEAFRNHLATLANAGTGRVDDIAVANVALGETFAEAAEQAREAAGLTRSEIDVIGSHGQTIWHVPDYVQLPGRPGRSRATLQIGDGSVIADRIDTTTVSDFRSRDVAAGGHGAPLAPLLDASQFAAGDRVRVLQNVGGIGNCTVLPPDPALDDVVAFDTGPGNMVMDSVVTLLTEGQRSYDEDGSLAAAGAVDDDLVATFLDEPYFQAAPPKTTGREQFGREYAERFVAAGRNRELDDEDIVASATALTARSIADAYDRFAPRYPEEVYVSGGGANNPTLMAMLETAVDAPVHRLEALGMNGDAKEAALFALLAVARLDEVPNNLPRATGADEPVIMGKVSLP
jgi:anhydro-N-acetylmuramic acid kinase